MRAQCLLAIAIAACTPETGVLVVIDAEGASASRARVLRVAAYEESGMQRLDRDVADSEGPPLPWRLLLTPRGGDAERRYELEAALVGEGDDTFSAILVEGGFERGAMRQISICFRDVCEGVTCGERESCVGGACAPIEEAPLTRQGEPACGDPECSGRQSGEPCAGGVCHGGGCCRGCWDGARCNRGDAADACGAAGADCGACAGHEVCASGACEPATVTSFDVGARHACAVVASNVYCWGASDAALGDAAAGPVRTPRRVSLPDDAWVRVATGDASCALSEAGSITCWGGAYGAPRAALVLDPPAAYTDLAVGVGMVCGIRADGALVCEGSNAWGQLGAGDVGELEGPVVVQQAFWIGASGDVEERPDGPQVFADVEAGAEGAAARRTDGTAFSWGRLARWNGTAYEDWAPPGPFLLHDATAWLDVGKTPRHHACVIDDAGVLSCGGWSEHGELGRASTEPWSPLDAIDAPLAWRDVAAGAQMSCAIATDGSLWCWGRNDRAQLAGASTLPDQTVPARVGDRTDWMEIEAWHGGCVLGDALYCWGANDEGQTGTGQSADSIATPTRVAFGE